MTDAYVLCQDGDGPLSAADLAGNQALLTGVRSDAEADSALATMLAADGGLLLDNSWLPDGDGFQGGGMELVSGDLRLEAAPRGLEALLGESGAPMADTAAIPAYDETSLLQFMLDIENSQG